MVLKYIVKFNILNKYFYTYICCIALIYEISVKILLILYIIDKQNIALKKAHTEN